MTDALDRHRASSGASASDPGDPGGTSDPGASSLEPLVADWVEGWTASRGLSATRRGGTWRVPIGLPDRWAEFVVPLGAGAGVDDRAADADDAASPDLPAAEAVLLDTTLAEAVDAGSFGDAVWVTVVVPPARVDAVVRAGLAAGLVVRSAEESFMAVELHHQAARAVPAGYVVDVAEARAARGTVLRAVASPDVGGAEDLDAAVDVAPDADPVDAASGRAGLTAAGTAVPDKIQTSEAHRRRGLGGAVMHALVDECRRRGAAHGLLVASVDGAGLYAALGWRRVASVVVLATH